MTRRYWGTLERIRRILVPRCYPQIRIPGCFPDRRTPGPGCYPSGGGSDEGKHPAPSNRRLHLSRAPFDGPVTAEPVSRGNESLDPHEAAT